MRKRIELLTVMQAVADAAKVSRTNDIALLLDSLLEVGCINQVELDNFLAVMDPVGNR